MRDIREQRTLLRASPLAGLVNPEESTWFLTGDLLTIVLAKQWRGASKSDQYWGAKLAAEGGEYECYMSVAAVAQARQRRERAAEEEEERRRARVRASQEAAMEEKRQQAREEERERRRAERKAERKAERAALRRRREEEEDALLGEIDRDDDGHGRRAQRGAAGGGAASFSWGRWLGVAALFMLIRFAIGMAFRYMRG